MNEYIDYIKTIIDITFKETITLLNNPEIDKSKHMEIKNAMRVYCTGYIQACGNFHIISEDAGDVLISYVNKKRGEL
jgi:hypothetical protein